MFRTSLKELTSKRRHTLARKARKVARSNGPQYLRAWRAYVGLDPIPANVADILTFTPKPIETTTGEVTTRTTFKTRRFVIGLDQIHFGPSVKKIAA